MGRGKKTVVLCPEFGFRLMSDLKARGATFVKKKNLRKKLGICSGSKGVGPLGFVLGHFHYINTLGFIPY